MIFLYLVILFAAIYLFLVFPGHPTAEQKRSFTGVCYAHRGLYDNDAGIPENSLAAFRRAVENGYGVELDVQFTSDKKLIVFHDNDLKRACGVDRPVWTLTYDEISRLRLFGTDERVPLFSEVLDVLGGKYPLVVEIKAEGVDTAWYAQVCRAAADTLAEYSGLYCIESFHPYVVRWVRRNMPDVFRGQLATGAPDYKNMGVFIPFILSRLLTSFYARPQFIAYNEIYAGFSQRLSRTLGASSFMWTVRDRKRHDRLVKTNDAVIFEHYMPETCFIPGK